MISARKDKHLDVTTMFHVYILSCKHSSRPIRVLIDILSYNNIESYLAKSFKYNLPPSFTLNDSSLSSSFKDFSPLERKE